MCQPFEIQEDGASGYGRGHLTLVSNAIDAMPDGGTLTIAGASRLWTETLERVFEPFFTTKTTGKSRGLGMAFTRVVRAHGGAVEIDSTVGRGPRCGSTCR